MGFVMPEVVVQRVIQLGMKNLREEDPEIFNDIFCQFLEPELVQDYGQSYIDSIRKWFFETKIPVLQAWTFNVQRLPSISVRLANEQEDESKAAIGDFYGENEDFAISTGVFSASVDIGIHADKDSDVILWLYYIISHILFKEKLVAESLGVLLHTWSASDYSKEQKYFPENVWSRWIRFRCITQNGIPQARKVLVEDLEVQVALESANDAEES